MKKVGKEKFKSIILNLSIFYMLVVSALVLFNIATAVSEIELNDSEVNKAKIEELRLLNNSLKQDKCTEIINDMIDYYNDTSYNGIVKLNQLYRENKNVGFLSFYIDVKDACNITDEKAKELELPTTFVTAAVQHDELFQAYMYQYELKISDTITRMVIEPELNNINYSIRKNHELKAIDNLVNYAIERNGINE